MERRKLMRKHHLRPQRMSGKKKRHYNVKDVGGGWHESEIHLEISKEMKE